MAIRAFVFAVPFTLLLAVVGSQVISYVCNQIPSGSPLFSLAGKLFVILEQDTPVNGYNYETTVYDATTATAAYGQAVCYLLLSPLECTTCLTFLGDHVWQVCNNAVAASVAYVDTSNGIGDNCSLTYSTYSY